LAEAEGRARPGKALLDGLRRKGGIRSRPASGRKLESVIGEQGRDAGGRAVARASLDIFAATVATDIAFKVQALEQVAESQSERVIGEQR